MEVSGLCGDGGFIEWLEWLIIVLIGVGVLDFLFVFWLLVLLVGMWLLVVVSVIICV